MMMLARYVSRDHWLIWLADGWRFPSWAPWPMAGNHGAYAVLLIKPAKAQRGKE